MSSSYVRTQVKNYITTNLPTEVVIDLSGQYEDVRVVIEDAGIAFDDAWLAIQFIGDIEEPISVGATNSAGCYREVGTVALHVVEPAKLGVATDILTRSESIINSFRGQRIGDILITGNTPPNFEKGATIEFESGYVSASILLSYQRDLNL